MNQNHLLKLWIVFVTLNSLCGIILIKCYRFVAFNKPALGAGFGTFGQPSTLPTLYQQPAQQQPAVNPDEAFAESIYNVSIFGDERDIVIAKWNYLQAMWGCGKAFYAKNLPPVEITPQNVHKHFIR